MIITIDGPAGAGKSTVARRVAERLGFQFLNTGAYYRAVALAALRSGIDPADRQKVAELAESLHVEQRNGRILLDGDDVTEQLSSLAVTQAVSLVADNPRVREHLKQLQRAWAAGKNLVTEGRDQGTEVFPDAELKIYLTASPEQRARRRYLELKQHGESVSFEQVLAQLTERDARDQSRTVGRLRQPPDAIVINTDGLGVDEVVARILQLVEHHRGLPGSG